MLSYQHAYHAGNLADVHKHAALAGVLAAMAEKPKPLHYIETHAGRGLYRLDSAEAAKTGEAEAGIVRAEEWFPVDDPYRRAIMAARAEHGPSAYPGSPLIAAHLLRPEDSITLAELHPAENEALRLAMPRGTIRREDGLALARAIAPPTPRRGVMLLDPSWELTEEWTRVPDTVAEVARKWPVGVLILWYPILGDERHRAMLRRLPEALVHEVRFPPLREGHGLRGSGLAIVNPPWRLADRLRFLSERFALRQSG